MNYSRLDISPNSEMASLKRPYKSLIRKQVHSFPWLFYIFQWINNTILKELGLTYSNYPLLLASVIGMEKAQHSLAFQS